MSLTELTNQVLDFFSAMSIEQAAFWLLIQNILQFALCLICGQIVITMFRKREIYELPKTFEKREILLSIGAIFFNTIVAICGWYLWKKGIIVIRKDTGPMVFVDVIALLLMMDFSMYITHRMCHYQPIYPFVHKTHHLYERPRPLSLFVLNPIEVFGFGALWLLVLTLYHSSWLGIVIYLLLNSTWGTLGHTGVEPFPKGWPRLPIIGRLSTSTFHAQHHQYTDYNFGFYTDIWDKLFGTVHATYDESV